MTTQQFIEKAIEGGWKGLSWDGMNLRLGTNDIFSMLLDPLAWQAVGKVEGWYDSKELIPNSWLMKQVEMVLALAEGKTIEKYLETL